MLLVRLRVLLARHPSIYWVTIAVIAAIVASAVWSATSRLDATRRSWGEQRNVWVAASDVDAGEPLVALARILPAAAVPAAAVTEQPIGQTAVQHIGSGEIVTVSDVGDGLLAVLPADWEAVAVPTDPARLPVAAGDHVAVYANGGQVAADGIVLDVTDGIVTVAVPRDHAGEVSVAARDQTAVLALRRP